MAGNRRCLSRGMVSPVFVNELLDYGDQNGMLTSAPTDFQHAPHELDSDALEEDQKIEEWDDPIVCYLEYRLTDILMRMCLKAVKKIAELGYAEEIAKWAILNSSTFYGSNKDVASNLSDGALAFLRHDREPKHPVFDRFEKLVHYTLLEMVLIIQELKPELAVWEAMCSLLAWNANLMYALAAEKKDPKKPESKAEPSGSNKSGST